MGQTDEVTDGRTDGRKLDRFVDTACVVYYASNVNKTIMCLNSNCKKIIYNALLTDASENIIIGLFPGVHRQRKCADTIGTLLVPWAAPAF